MGTAALVLGVLAGVGGFFLYDFVTCVSRIGDLCIGASRPYETGGLVIMVFGGILVVLGILLFALPERGIPTAPRPASREEDAPPPSPQDEVAERSAERTARMQWSPKKTLLVILGLAGAIIGGIVGSALILQGLSQPNVTLVEPTYSRAFCFFGPPQSYTASFTLVNNGNADGFANVQFVIDGTVVANNNYFITQGTSVQKSLTASLNDCNEHSLDVRIASIWK